MKMASGIIMANGVEAKRKRNFATEKINSMTTRTDIGKGIKRRKEGWIHGNAWLG